MIGERRKTFSREKLNKLKRKKWNISLSKLCSPSRSRISYSGERKMRVKASRVLKSSLCFPLSLSFPLTFEETQNRGNAKEKVLTQQRIHIIIRRSVKVGEENNKNLVKRSFSGPLYSVDSYPRQRIDFLAREEKKTLWNIQLHICSEHKFRLCYHCVFVRLIHSETWEVTTSEKVSVILLTK